MDRFAAPGSGPWIASRLQGYMDRFAAPGLFKSQGFYGV